MKPRIAAPLALAASLILLLTSAGHQHPPVGPHDPQLVSLLQLICNPEKYDGKLISVVGFLHLERGGDLLYHSEEDYKHGIAENAVWIERTDQMSGDNSGVDLKYVRIVGVFRPHRTLWRAAGTIGEIRRIVVWSDPREPRRFINRRTRPQ